MCKKISNTNKAHANYFLFHSSSSLPAIQTSYIVNMAPLVQSKCRNNECRCWLIHKSTQSAGVAQQVRYQHFSPSAILEVKLVAVQSVYVQADDYTIVKLVTKGHMVRWFRTLISPVMQDQFIFHFYSLAAMFTLALQSAITNYYFHLALGSCLYLAQILCTQRTKKKVWPRVGLKPPDQFHNWQNITRKEYPALSTPGKIKIRLYGI